LTDNTVLVISIIIPVHNAEDTIERTIDSVLDQTYDDYEIIVIDDGSSDTTGQLLEKYFSKINLIKG
jgi:glycosyltransferase involved in cell wall biosynthesis